MNSIQIPEGARHKVVPGEAYIEAITVVSHARGMGVGGKLMKWAEEKARERGCTFMQLTVLDGNPAKRLYERNGFVELPPEGCIATCLTVILVGMPFGTCSGSSPRDMKKDLAV